MSIEITGPASSPVSSQGGGTDVQSVDPNGSQAQGQNNNQAHTDVVTITSSAAQLHAAERGLKAVPVVDQERVDRIRDAIQNGEYQIDPAKIADKFIRLESALYR
jgi:negative regulator of flagellin synthesis FlgM